MGAGFVTNGLTGGGGTIRVGSGGGMASVTSGSAGSTTVGSGTAASLTSMASSTTVLDSSGITNGASMAVSLISFRGRAAGGGSICVASSSIEKVTGSGDAAGSGS